jgi:thioredoxin-dependent peroxiredoxin
MLGAGDVAPAFRARTTTNEEVSLASYRGKWLVLYFYPRAFTPGCTRETIAFRDHQEEIRSLGAEIVGVSRDTHTLQCEFAERHRLRFPLIADHDGVISRAYDAVHPLFGRGRRVTYVIDPEGRIARRIAHEVRIHLHLEEVVDFLRQPRNPA